MATHPERELHRLLVEEPFVRSLARQLVVDDADEVVQQTWLRALQQGSRDIERPRHWLARIVRNVAANLRRGDRRRRDRQQAAAVHELVPSPAELAEREERRRALIAAVDALPPALRTVVLLRWFEGLPPRTIAAVLGVPAATVSTQLQRALAQLRQRLDAAHGGDRRAWAVPLVSFALRPELPLPGTALPGTALPGAALPAAPMLITGAIAMTTKTKLIATVAVLALAAGFLFRPGPGAPSTSPPTASAPANAEPVEVKSIAPVSEPAPAAPTLEREAVESAAGVAAATGTLTVHVRYGDDHAPAPGVLLILRRANTDARFTGRRLHTDEAGTSRYDGLQPGRYYVGNDNNPGKRVEIAAGQTVEETLDLDVGITVTGIVVDGNHAPVAGALVEAEMMARSDVFPEVVAVTGADGRFAARALPYTCLVGARAAGFTASPVRFVHGKKGNTAEIELVLGADGGTIDGLVVDAAGKPVADAVVIVGKGKVSGIPGQDHIPPFAAVTRSGTDGAFRAVGIEAGEQPVCARAAGFAPWTGACEVTAGATATHRIALEPGAVIRGTVTDQGGKPAGGVEVEIGRWDDLAHVRAASAADGSFDLGGLPIGEFEVRASHDNLGKGSRTVRTEPGKPATCDLQLSRGLELKGRVVDDAGQPVPDIHLECMAETGAPNSWFAFASADAQGRFVAANCPEKGTIMIVVRGDRFEELWQRGIDPKVADLVLHLKRLAPSTVRISGTVFAPDGRPVANASVYAAGTGTRTSPGLQATDNNGRFELGPVPPGTWRVTVRIPDYPEYTSEPRQLDANATWDLGAITLARGGTARVHLLGPALDGMFLYAAEVAGTHTFPVADAAGGYRTTSLAAGDYHLMVAGKGVAVQTVPFTIRVAEEVVVELQPQTGVSQRFVCALPAGAKADGVTLRVLQGAAYRGRVWALAHGDAAMTAETWLVPGDYTVNAEAGDLRGSASFTVGAVAGDPVRIALR